MSLRSSSCKSNNNNSPPWQVLVLVANLLDPKTLAIASCVSKSWLLSMSSDHLWNPICSAHFPSLSALRLAGPNASYRRIYALGRASAKRRLRSPPNPLISLRDLMFTVDVHTNNGARVLTVAKPGAELVSDPEGVFRFDLDVRDEEYSLVAEELEGLRVTWNVVLEGLEGVFTMMECRGKGSFVPGSDGWFSEELPSPGCCSGAAVSGLVADLWLGLRRLEGPDGDGSGKVVGLEKVGVGVLSGVSWRYVGLDDALRYLQHFLMPSSV